MIEEGTSKEEQPEAADNTAAEDGKNETSGGSYVVKRGDSLWKIAARIYGDGTKWTDIYAANSGIIVDPSLIYPGEELMIPAA